MMPTTKSIQAMFAAVPAIPENPNSPATIAMIKKVAAQPIMVPSLLGIGIEYLSFNGE